MASSAAGSPFAASSSGSARDWLRNPTLLYFVAAVVILGGCALHAAFGHWPHQSTRDVYQHVASLRALMANLRQPSNPFVVSAEGSRHFHPYWVAMALLGRTFGWTVWQTIGVASFLNMGVMAVGIFVFAREYYRSAWGPLALLLSALLGWSLPISHTGFLNIPTLVEGASYPAALLIGLSFILWALVIRSLRDHHTALFIVPLVAFMFATHQLGAGLGLIVATFLLWFWPAGSARAKCMVTAAFAGGLLLSAAWPYQNPFVVMLRAGNPSWDNGIEWYTPRYLFALLVPSMIGLMGLFGPIVPGTGRPLLAVLPILVIGFASGAVGFMTGTRFAPTAALVLQIGIAAMLVRVAESPAHYSDRSRKALAAAIFGAVFFQFLLLAFFYWPKEYRFARLFGNVYDKSAALTASIPDNQPVAAYSVAAWPIVANGQKVLSIPWPEPMISDLARRQALVEQLFNPRIPRDQRIKLAKAVGVRTLILDDRYGKGRAWEFWELYRLRTQAKKVTSAWPLERYDLY